MNWLQANQAPRVRPVLERRAYGAYLSAGQLASSLRIGVKCRAQDVPLITHVQCSGRKARSRDDSHSMPASRFEGRPTRLAEWNSLRAQEGTCGFVREQCDSDPWPSCVEACEIRCCASYQPPPFRPRFPPPTRRAPHRLPSSAVACKTRGGTTVA